MRVKTGQLRRPWLVSLVGVWLACLVVWAVGLASASTTDVLQAPSSTEEPALEADDTYKGIPDVCTVVDLSGLVDITGVGWTGQVETQQAFFEEPAHYSACNSQGAQSRTVSLLTVAVYPTADAAANEYSRHVNDQDTWADVTSTDIDPAWTRSSLALADSHTHTYDTSITFNIVAQADNLLLLHTFSLAEPDGSAPDYADSAVTNELIEISVEAQTFARDE